MKRLHANYFWKKVDKLFHTNTHTHTHTHTNKQTNKQKVVCFADCLSIATVIFFIVQEIFKARPVLEAVKMKMHIKT